MKKKILYIGIGLILFFLLSFILTIIMVDEEYAFVISASISIIYFMLLTIITYSKNLYKYLKTGKFPDNSNLANIISDLLTTSKSANRVLIIFTYTLFYIGLLGILVFFLISFVFPDILDSISEILLWIVFISVTLAVFTILIFTASAIDISTKTIMKNREKEYQQLKQTNKFAYDLKAFKRGYGKPYYTLVYIGIIDVIIYVLIILYTKISNNYVPAIIGNVLSFILMFEIWYLPFFFPVIIHTLKMNSKRQVITLDPFEVKMITKDGFDEYHNYERIEKNYFVDAIESYRITSRYIIIEGQIKAVINKTFDSSIKEKNKIIKRLKIPRVFNNENILIEYLESNLKN